VLLLLLMALEFKGRGGEAHDFLAKLYKRQCLFIESLVKTGQARESFAPTCVPRELASIVLGAHDGTFLEWFRRPAALRGAELVRARRSTVFARTVSRHFEFFKVRNYVDIFFGRPMFLLRSVKSLSKGVEDEKESKWARPFVGDGGGCIDGVAVDGCLCG